MKWKRKRSEYLQILLESYKPFVIRKGISIESDIDIIEITSYLTELHELKHLLAMVNMLGMFVAYIP